MLHWNDWMQKFMFFILKNMKFDKVGSEMPPACRMFRPRRPQTFTVNDHGERPRAERSC